MLFFTGHSGTSAFLKRDRLCLIVGKNKPRNTHVFETTAKQAEWRPRTARTRVWASCAHASLCNFTSGSRCSLSRPRILRSLIKSFTLHKRSKKTRLHQRANPAENNHSKSICVINLVPQGFSLKKWVGREKALASAGHVSPRTP